VRSGISKYETMGMFAMEIEVDPSGKIFRDFRVGI